ncbi:MAG: hypothetical protein ABJF11_08100 [Reichenbachiella sp.]|uniref:hypothetical protein n=1 Tax=Reichenbachiella sp. TaxID=2184521 RepID=UPI003266F901
MKVSAVLLIAMFCPLAGYSQDSLVLKNGKRIAYTRLVMYDDQVEIKNEQTKEFETYPCELVYGYSEGMKERTYFLKSNPESEGSGYFFLKRLKVGRVSLFENTGNDQSLYVEKDGRFEKALGLTEKKSKKVERLETFKSFVADDDESLAYIASSGFKFGWKDISRVIEYYNKRNFIEREPSGDDVYGYVYLYRTQFQKTKQGIKITLNGQQHDLYIEDYIILSLPVAYASMLHLRDSEVNSTQILSGELEEQYFEVLYDSKTNTFKFDKKEGTELRYEFFKIKDKVGARVIHD